MVWCIGMWACYSLPLLLDRLALTQRMLKKKFATICTFLFANPKNANNRIVQRLVRFVCLQTPKHAIFRILQRLFPFFLRTQLLGSQKEREQSLQNSAVSCFMGSQNKKNRAYRCQIRLLAFFGFAKRKVQIVAKIFFSIFSVTPVDPAPWWSVPIPCWEIHLTAGEVSPGNQYAAVMEAAVRGRSGWLHNETSTRSNFAVWC